MWGIDSCESYIWSFIDSVGSGLLPRVYFNSVVIKRILKKKTCLIVRFVFCALLYKYMYIHLIYIHL